MKSVRGWLLGFGTARRADRSLCWWEKFLGAVLQGMTGMPANVEDDVGS